MKSCESGCGGTVRVHGCKWCPDCYSNFSMGQSLNERAFVVNSGKYETWDFRLEENIKFSSEPLLLQEAEEVLEQYKGYDFARIEYIGEQRDI